jgi:uncharacterized membrane protein
MNATPHLAHPTDQAFLVRTVPSSRPFIWLGRGWEDLCDHPLASLAYGAMVSSLGALILAYSRNPFYISAVISAFLLVGPVMTAGLCELSRRRDTGETRDFATSLQGLRHNRSALLSFSRRLLLLGVAWFFIANMMLHIALGSAGPGMTETVGGDVLRHLSANQVMAYIGIGGILAAMVFAVSVVAVPMMVDLCADANSAMKTSLRVSLRDLPAMIVWSALIAALVAIGFMTFLVGMVVIFPLLGHATWHAYRDLVH